MAWDWLPIRSIIKNKGIDLQSAYPSYKLMDETMEQVLFLCPRARQVWYIAGLHQSIIQAEAPVQEFLELLRWNTKDDATRVVGIRAACVTGYPLHLSI